MANINFGQRTLTLLGTGITAATIRRNVLLLALRAAMGTVTRTTLANSAGRPISRAVANIRRLRPCVIYAYTATTRLTRRIPAY